MAQSLTVNDAVGLGDMVNQLAGYVDRLHAFVELNESKISEIMKTDDYSAYGDMSFVPVVFSMLESSDLVWAKEMLAIQERLASEPPLMSMPPRPGTESLYSKITCDTDYADVGSGNMRKINGPRVTNKPVACFDPKFSKECDAKCAVKHIHVWKGSFVEARKRCAVYGDVPITSFNVLTQCSTPFALPRSLHLRPNLPNLALLGHAKPINNVSLEVGVSQYATKYAAGKVRGVTGRTLDIHQDYYWHMPGSYCIPLNPAYELVFCPPRVQPINVDLDRIFTKGECYKAIWGPVIGRGSLPGPGVFKEKVDGQHFRIAYSAKDRAYTVQLLSKTYHLVCDNLTGPSFVIDVESVRGEFYLLAIVLYDFVRFDKLDFSYVDHVRLARSVSLSIDGKPLNYSPVFDSLSAAISAMVDKGVLWEGVVDVSGFNHRAYKFYETVDLSLKCAEDILAGSLQTAAGVAGLTLHTSRIPLFSSSGCDQVSKIFDEFPAGAILEFYTIIDDESAGVKFIFKKHRRDKTVGNRSSRIVTLLNNVHLSDFILSCYSCLTVRRRAKLFGMLVDFAVDFNGLVVPPVNC
jgi:hypothetical protein